MRSITAAIAAATATAIVVSSSFAIAAIPNSSTKVITGCYLKTSGTLRVIDKQANKTCKTTEIELSWNQQGVKGDTGQQGLVGLTGPAGAKGTNGLNGTNGVDGAPGATGPGGAAGRDGTNGIDGTQGAQGPAGTAGAPGNDGAQGSTGPQGLLGPAGPQGEQGPKGVAGPPGPSGVGTSFFVDDATETRLGELVSDANGNYIVWDGAGFRRYRSDGTQANLTLLFYADLQCAGVPNASMGEINGGTLNYGEPLVVRLGGGEYLASAGTATLLEYRSYRAPLADNLCERVQSQIGFNRVLAAPLSIGDLVPPAVLPLKVVAG